MATELARRIRGTRPDIGNRLRQEWLNAHDVECEPLTFGDLQKGDKFISMPSPGDNSGHGGFLNGSYLFMKTDLVTHSTPFSKSLPANSIRLSDGSPTHCHDTMWILKIE